MAGSIYRPYQQSESVTQAQQAAAAHSQTRPGDYQSRYESRISALQGQIADRQPFRYNINGDALYQQYRDRYASLGRQAMQHTMGQAAGLTGGYGSSYGQAAGQQQYNAYLQQLNNIVPELQANAYNRYNQETQDLYNRYNMYYNQEAQDYSRWNDQMNAYNTELNRLQNVYDNERNYDYNQWQDQRDFDRGLGDSYYARLTALITSYGYVPTDAELAMAGMDRAQSEAMLPRPAAYNPSYPVIHGTQAAPAASPSASSGSGLKKITENRRVTL